MNRLFKLQLGTLILCGAALTSQAQSAQFAGREKMAVTTTALLAGNYTWNRSLWEIEPEEATTTASDEPETVVDAAVTSTNEAYAEKMRQQAIDHDLILRRMDSLNNHPYALQYTPEQALTAEHVTKNEYIVSVPVTEVSAEADHDDAKLKTEISRQIPGVKYAIVLGSFNIAANAERYNTMMKEAGYKTAVIYSEDTSKHRVLVASETKDSALATAKKIRKTTAIRDAWALFLGSGE